MENEEEASEVSSVVEEWCVQDTREKRIRRRGNVEGIGIGREELED